MRVRLYSSFTFLFAFCLLYCACPLRADTGVENVLVLFDLSHSMSKPVPKSNGPVKIEIARAAFEQTIANLPDGVDLSLMSFGNGTSANKELDCSNTTMLKPFGEEANSEVISQLKSAVPNGRETPISYALEKAIEEIKRSGKSAKIILISDGAETCDRNPADLAQQIADFGVSIDTIGIGTPGMFAELGEIALAGGGEFFLAANMLDLSAAMFKAMGAPKALSVPAGSAASKNLGSFNISSVSTTKSPVAAPGALVQVIPVILDPEISLPEVSEMVANQQGGPVVSMEIILDSSGSMIATLDGRKKIDLAKEAFETTIAGINTELIQVAFRAYGFDSSVEKTQAASCPNTELLVDFGGEPQAIITKANSLEAYGYTPIAESLRLAGADLKPYANTHRTITLISDGKETCGGDPVAVLEELKKQGIDVQVHVIGFDIDAETRNQLQAIATAGGGKYFDASNAKGLVSSLQIILDEVEQKAEELAPDRIINPIKGGETIQTAVEISAGTYTLSEHLDKGLSTYFFVPSKIAQRMVLIGFTQAPRLVQDESGELSEATSASASFLMKIFSPADISKAKLRPRRVVLVSGKLGAHSLTHYFDLSGQGVYFSLDGGMERMNKDTLFKVELQDAGDINVGLDAPVSHKQELQRLNLGEEITGHLGIDDLADSYLLESLPDSMILPLEITFSDEVRSRRAAIKPKIEAFRFKVEIYHPKSRKRLQRFIGLVGEAKLELDVPEGLDKLVIKVSYANPNLLNMFSYYKLRVGN